MLEDDLLEDTATVDAPNDSKRVEDALADAALDFDGELREMFATNPGGYKKIRTIGSFIMRGMSLKESCVLSRIAYEQFEELMQKHPPISDFITFKQIAYKASLVNVLAGSATTGKMAKVAGYLLENQYRDDFGKKTKDERVRPLDALEQAIAAVRENGDSQPLVRPSLPAGTVHIPSTIITSA